MGIYFILKGELALKPHTLNHHNIIVCLLRSKVEGFLGCFEVHLDESQEDVLSLVLDIGTYCKIIIQKGIPLHMLSEQAGCLILKIFLLAFICKVPALQLFGDVVVVPLDLSEMLKFQR